MNTIPFSWDAYYERVGVQPRKLLVSAMDYVLRKNYALDLGAGNLRDTAYLLTQGFIHIDAVDNYPGVASFAKNFDSNCVRVYITSFQNFDYAKRYDLINAQYALPFIPPCEFYDTFTKITRSLADSGIITGQFFGMRDSWANNNQMTFLQREEVELLLKDFEILYLNEQEREDITACDTNPKHWHIFDFIAKLKKTK